MAECACPLLERLPASPASFGTRIDRAFGDFVPPLLLFGRPELFLAAVQALGLLVLIPKERTIRSARGVFVMSAPMAFGGMLNARLCWSSFWLDPAGDSAFSYC